MNFRLTESDSILRLEDQAWIPRDTGNQDYQAFLKWEAEGNTPLPVPAPQAHRVPNAIDKLAAFGITVDELKDLLGIKK